MNSFFFWLSLLANVITVVTALIALGRRISRKRKRSQQSVKK